MRLLVFVANERCCDYKGLINVPDELTTFPLIEVRVARQRGCVEGTLKDDNRNVKQKRLKVEQRAFTHARIKRRRLILIIFTLVFITVKLALYPTLSITFSCQLTYLSTLTAK